MAILVTVVAIGEPMVPVLDGVCCELRVHGSHCGRDISHGAGYLSVTSFVQSLSTGAAARRPGHAAPVAADIAAKSPDATGS